MILICFLHNCAMSEEPEKYFFGDTVSYSGL